MPNELLDLVNDSLTKLDNSIHDKIEGSFIDNFIHELQDHLSKLQSSTLLDSMSQYTILTFAKYHGDFAVCFDYNDKKIYYMPQKDIVRSET